MLGWAVTEKGLIDLPRNVYLRMTLTAMGRSFCSISSVTCEMVLIYVIWDSPERNGLTATLIFPFSYWLGTRGNNEPKGREGDLGRQGT